MKIKILFTILCTLWCPIALLAQPSQVLPEDSLALIEIYNEFGGAQSGLNWLNGPVDSWGDTENEIVVADYDEEFVLRVVEINIAGKGLSGNLSEAINALDALRRLSISNNEIDELPDALNLPNLIHLSISGNQLTTVPDLDALVNLQIFNCASNQLSVLPELDQLTQLRTFNFTNNHIMLLPDLSELQNLTHLGGAANRLTFLPDLSPLVNLRSLSVCCNRLESLPNLNSLYNLEELSCYSNQLTELPPLDSLSNLRELHFGSNKLSVFPDLSNLESLQFINCSRNFFMFEDIVPIVNIADSVVYAPQADIPWFDYHYSVGSDDTISVYDVSSPHPYNVYQWIKNQGAIINNTSTLILSDMTKADSADYELRVTNPLAPDLVIEGETLVSVYDSTDTIPFDTTTLIVRGPSVQDSDAREDMNIVICHCSNAEIPLGLLQDIPNLIELNTIRKGALSEIERDTFDFNFKIFQDPIDESFSCGVSFNTPSSVADPSFQAKVAVIGSGVAPHTDLQRYFYNVEDSVPFGLRGCIETGQVAWDFVDSTQSIIVENPHETHIAGIIAKNFPDNIDLDIIDLKVFEEEGYLFDLICAIYFAISAEVDVINLSLGYYADFPSAPLYDALKKAEEAGIIVVISAGNDGKNNAQERRWPGNFSTDFHLEGMYKQPLTNLIVVAALNNSLDTIASFSNYGKSEVQIAAPGTGVVSTIVENETRENSYMPFSGTSMAAGEVSRVAAILKAYAPDIAPYQIINEIIKSGDKVVPNGRPIMLNTKVNLINAMRKLEIEGRDTIIPYLDSSFIPDISNDRPPAIIHNRHNSLREIEIEIGPGDLIYRKIEFSVRHIGGSNSNPNIPIFKKECAFGNKIYWNGVLDNGHLIDLNLGEYLVDIKVNGYNINVFPPNIRE